MERDVGIVGYLTSTPAVGGTIKSVPEDFVVEEISAPPPPSDGSRAFPGPPIPGTFTILVIGK